MLDYTKLIEEIDSEIAEKSKIIGNKYKTPTKIYINMELYRACTNYAYDNYYNSMNMFIFNDYKNLKLKDIPCEMKADQTEPFVIEYVDVFVINNQKFHFEKI